MASGHQSVAQRMACALRWHRVEVIFGQSLPSALILASAAKVAAPNNPVVALVGDDASALRPAIEKALRGDMPSLIEVMTDPEAHPPLSLYGGTLDHTEAPIPVQSSRELRGEEHAVSP